MNDLVTLGFVEITPRKVEWKKQCPKCGKDQYYKDKYHLHTAIRLNKTCIACQKIGKPHSEIHKKNNSLANLGKHNHPKTEEWKRKLRISKWNRFKKLGIGAREDKGAKEWFRELNTKGFNYQPYYLEEQGYHADGYDKEKHIWYEYDTPYHAHEFYRQKDLIRQSNIINYFNSVGRPLNHFIRARADGNGNVLSETDVVNQKV